MSRETDGLYCCAAQVLDRQKEAETEADIERNNIAPAPSTVLSLLLHLKSKRQLQNAECAVEPRDLCKCRDDDLDLVGRKHVSGLSVAGLSVSVSVSRRGTAAEVQCLKADVSVERAGQSKQAIQPAEKLVRQTFRAEV